MNDQRSLTEQLQDLARLADKEGLYDAADYIRWRIEGIPSPCDIKDLQLPQTTKQFAQWLRDIATQVARIADRAIRLREEDVEVGFYYGDPLFPRRPTGLHFAVDFATTKPDAS